MTVPAATGTALSFEQADVFLRQAVDLTADGSPQAGLADVLEDYRRLALRPGALVAIALPNGRGLLRHFLATALSGLVPVLLPPATPLSRVGELAGYLNIAAYVANRRQSDRLGAGRTRPVGTEHAAVLPAGEEHAEQYAPGDVVMLTSGTSGMFSACVNRFDALLRNARRHNTAVGVRAGDTALVILPLYYSYAIVAQALSALVAGARLVVDGPPFSPERYRTTIEAHGIDLSATTPTIARQLIDEGVALPRGLRALAVGGDQLAGRQVGELLALHGDELYLTYGLTEAGPRVATLAAHREPSRRWDSVGLPLPGVAVRLRDVHPGGVGELLVESDTVLRREAGQVRRQALLAPGRIATGDLFSLDSDGYLYFAGRRRDFVVVGGEKVSLYSMKLAAESLPGVVRAQTSVTSYGDGPVIELVAHVADPARTTADVVTGRLGRLLMRKERPHRVRVVPADRAEFHK